MGGRSDADDKWKVENSDCRVTSNRIPTGGRGAVDGEIDGDEVMGGGRKGFYYRVAAMYLQFYINENGDKVYTTKKESPIGLATQSAHPARFSPDDKYSRQRVLLKKRFGLLPTQQPPQKY
ncbi:hypothetical protein SAY86_000416 [Trapa natans]|uniref:Nucleolar protein 10 n=1 Tax=Trapa natans TaxID=22666 RepID=A0AAN7M3Z9_TRANT|nr:hypothetical protein SAY86_000416 [Trapa natans]